MFSSSIRESEEKSIDLSEPETITDLWNDKTLAENTGRLEMGMKANKTYMYLLE